MLQKSNIFNNLFSRKGLTIFALSSLFVIISIAVKLGLANNFVAFAQTVFNGTMKSGEIANVKCDGFKLAVSRRNSKEVTLKCIAPTTPTTPPAPTPDPVPTPPHEEGKGICGESNDTWHSPVVNNCETGHEHGDSPPTWVVDSKWKPMFTHAANTPNENILKHSSFKGFTLNDDDVEVYFVMHLDSNPSGHSTRFHSYQAWAKDASGAVSYWDLWADFGEGDNTGSNLRPVDGCGAPQFVRPIMAVNYPECEKKFENWYNRAGAPGWAWDFGINILAQYYNGPRLGTSSSSDLSAISTWLPTGDLNSARRIELSWYSFRDHPTGTFYSTQFGEIVTGPEDTRCGTTKTLGTKSYTVLCLEQYIAPTMTSVSFPDNSVQKNYDMTGVKLPN